MATTYADGYYTNASEKLAVKCEAVIVRLVYNKYNE
jgi:hypothetical protein